ncbi:MAG: energy transducer TonB [Gammaproteobacteria bacterium]
MGRVAYLVSGALAVNLLLFLAIEQMASKLHSAPVMRTFKLVDFVRLKRETPPPEVNERVPPPKTEQDLTPRMDVPIPSSVPTPAVDELSVPAPNIGIPMRIAGGPYIGKLAAGGGGYREPIPLVRIQPLYPPHARDHSIEGLVRVAFTVDVDGSVKDPVIVSAKPTEIFDYAVLSAIRHWKFETKVIDGKPVPWSAQQTVAFRMDR